MNEPTPSDKSLEDKISDLTTRMDHLQQVSALSSKIERLKFYRDEDAREWTLLSNRVNAYVTSQSFLVSATVIAMGNTAPNARLFRLAFPLILLFIGLGTSILAYQGVTSAMDVIRLWKDKSAALASATETGHENPLDDYLLLKRQQYNWLRIVNKDLFARFRAQVTDPEIDDIHLRSLKFALLTPWFFGVAWVIFGVLEVLFYLLL